MNNLRRDMNKLFDEHDELKKKHAQVVENSGHIIGKALREKRRLKDAIRTALHNHQTQQAGSIEDIMKQLADALLEDKT